METRFEQNRDFNQSHKNKQNNEYKKGEPQGREGDPNQRLVKRNELDNSEKELNRRTADVEKGSADSRGSNIASAIPGIQSDQQNSTRSTNKPSGQY